MIIIWSLSSLSRYLLRQLYTIGWKLWSLALVCAMLFACVYLWSHRSKERLWRKAVASAFLGGYTVVLFSVAVFSRVASTDKTGINLDTIGICLARMQNVGGMRYELVANTGMLLPVGFLLPIASDTGFGLTALFGFVLTLSLETAQLVLVRGWFELSDIVRNTIGVLVGYGIDTFLYALE